MAEEFGVKRVSEIVGVSNPTIYGWRSQAEEPEDDDTPQLDVTRVSVHSHAAESETNVVARFWIGENAIEILSADVVFELARRSVGGMA
jgi:transposase-like protein